VSVVQGQAGAALVRRTRDSGYTANVTLGVDSLPAGITGVPARPILAGDTTSLAVTVAATVTPGRYPIVVRGSAVNRPAIVDPLRLTVVAAPAAITATVAPTTGDSTVALLTVGNSAAIGTVTVIFTGSGTGVASASASLTVTVSPPAAATSRGGGARIAAAGETSSVPMNRRRAALRCQ
jgi:hypothetical protein